MGTTPDYIDWIRRSCPDRAIFITAPDIRRTAAEDSPAPCEELRVTLADHDLVFNALQQHRNQWGYTLDGIFCFDCEYMELTAFLAGRLNLDYPPLSAIQLCRSKIESKRIWQEHGIACPRTVPINRASDAVDFLKTAPMGCVLKPVAGSGSELVFKCIGQAECRAAFNTIKKGLKNRKHHPLFRQPAGKDKTITGLMIAEELISGTEYSCDFTIENKTVRIIRIAEKIKSPSKPFGTITGYMLPAKLPISVLPENLEQILFRAATVLGIDRGLCMVDFIISNNHICLIELTPRPGGDCLPHLIKATLHIDILNYSLDFAQKHVLDPIPVNTVRPHVGIRLHANANGILKNIDTRHLKADARVKQIHLTKSPGHRIILPPDDYDSWLLGHIIIEPSNDRFPGSQAITISKRIDIMVDSLLQEAS